uniref:Cytochrome c6 n=1 Tax=Lithothamnion sp. TaxID=1940749 RepID=A0A3G3MGJ8_9FLOR|nr:cytochrome c553 [Lithothamnion sp.]
MNKLLTLLLVLSTLLIDLVPEVYAVVDLGAGEQIFSSNCSACHAGGNNAIMPEKTLKKGALEENSMNDLVAITTQVKNGKNAMPAFGGKLADDEINNVANYVLTQSEQGW